MYNKIYEEYGKMLFEKVLDVIFVSKKWSDNDLVWPFSDLDFRLITDNKTIDFYTINEIIFSIQKEIIQKDSKILGRILEHPPGYIFKYSELIDNYMEDINNWSFCYGEKKKFDQIKKINGEKRLFDYNYYINIIKKRYKKFSFNTEYIFDDEKLNKCYRLYCVLWHYYFPCVYALNSLKNHSSQKNKIISTPNSQKEIILSVYNDIITNNFDNLYKYNLTSVINAVDTEIKYNIEEEELNNKNNCVNTNKYLEAISMLRTRIARYLLYLDSPQNNNKDYLIKREINELKFIISEIYKKNNNFEIKELYEYVNSDKEAINILEYTIKYLYKHRDYFNQLMNINKGDYYEV